MVVERHELASVHFSGTCTLVIRPGGQNKQDDESRDGNFPTLQALQLSAA
jgi:hypothetical protein